VSFPYHLTGTTLSAFIDGAPYQTDKSNPNWSSIVALLNDPATTSDQLINAIKPIRQVTAALTGVVDVQVAGGDIIINGELVDNYLTQSVLRIIAEGFDVEPWVKFVQNVYANPFVEAREEFYAWMERAKMPITPSGCFLAYKVVNSNFLDRYSRTFDNHRGNVVSMPREDCDNSSRALCSKGLHFCSASYLPTFGVYEGDHIMLIEINPADVVSIPTSETDKGRTWRYEVVGEISREMAGVKSWLPIDSTWDVPEDEDEEFGLDETGTSDVPISVRVKDANRVVETKQYGPITFERFVQMRANNGGTNAGLAKALDVPAGTVGKWLAKFKKLGCKV
jgi:hypothetical protein